MIRCNLSVLLAERNLKISKVSEETKLSRTTLTALVSNVSKGIQFDTINTLCCYFKVTPEKLISYIPVDIIITRANLNGEILQIDLDIIKNMKTYKCELTGYCYTSYNDDNEIKSLDIEILLYDDESNSDDEELIENNKVLINTFTKLPVPFRNDIRKEILKYMGRTFRWALAEDCTMHFTWDNKLIDVE